MKSYHYPCTPDCERRKPGCHDRCKEFLDAKAESNKIKEARIKAHEADDYHVKAVVKNSTKTIKKKMGK